MNIGLIISFFELSYENEIYNWLLRYFQWEGKLFISW